MSKFLVLKDSLKDDTELNRVEILSLLDILEERLFELESQVVNPYSEEDYEE